MLVQDFRLVFLQISCRRVWKKNWTNQHLSPYDSIIFFFFWKTPDHRRKTTEKITQPVCLATKICAEVTVFLESPRSRKIYVEAVYTRWRTAGLYFGWFWHKKLLIFLALKKSRACFCSSLWLQVTRCMAGKTTLPLFYHRAFGQEWSNSERKISALHLLASLHHTNGR